MSTEQLPTPSFNDPKADAILVSSDQVRFRVHKPILGDASPIFGSMFTLPPPSPPISDANASEDELPVVPVTEHSSVVEQLLRFCYPSRHGTVNDLHTLRQLFTAAEKYDMKGVTAQLAIMMLWQFVEKEPHRVYAIACIYGLWDQAVIAGKQTLKCPWPEPSVPEYEELSATMYHKLLVYRHKCTSVLRPVVDDWRSAARDDASYFCDQCAAFGRDYLPMWTVDYLEEMKAMFLVRPRGDTVLSPRLIQETMEKYLSSDPHLSCECHINAPTDLLELSEKLAATLDQELEKIPFELK